MNTKHLAREIAKTYCLKDREGKGIPDTLVKNTYFLERYFEYLLERIKVYRELDDAGNSLCPICNLIVYTLEERKNKRVHHRKVITPNIYCYPERCRIDLKLGGYTLDKDRLTYLYRPDCEVLVTEDGRLSLLYESVEVGFLLYKEDPGSIVNLNYIELYEKFRGKGYSTIFIKKIERYFTEKFKTVNICNLSLTFAKVLASRAENYFIMDIINRNIKDLAGYCKNMNYDEDFTELIFELKFYHLFFDDFDNDF